MAWSEGDPCSHNCDRPADTRSYAVLGAPWRCAEHATSREAGDRQHAAIERQNPGRAWS